jgi:hypothetical protein
MHTNDHWQMSNNAVSFLDKQYAKNPLQKIRFNPKSKNRLLNKEEFLPFYHNGTPVDDNAIGDTEFNESIRNNLNTSAGYTYPHTEEIYLKDLNYVGHEAMRVGPMSPYIYDSTSGASDWQQKMVHKNKHEQAVKNSQEAQDLADWESSNIARTGVHETIHSNLLSNIRGAYPNAISEMLRGTSALGVPDDTNNYLDVETGGRLPESPRYQQNEFLTQALTEYLYPRANHPDMPENASMGSQIYADYPYEHWSMDKPGGAMTKEGLDELLFKAAQPFYEQILSDAEAGYVQPSIWSQ